MTKSLSRKRPRTDSLHQRLISAKDANGQPAPFLDELLVFLEAPPPGTGDRWQAGAELCEKAGIGTSRMAVWRFYHVHILQWRREQAPDVEVVPEETNRLLDQARHLTALRTVENLHDPSLPPGILVGLIQGENRRQELLLARDQFKEQLRIKRLHEHLEHVQRVENRARDKALFSSDLKTYRNIFTTLIKASQKDTDSRIPPTTT